MKDLLPEKKTKKHLGLSILILLISCAGFVAAYTQVSTKINNIDVAAQTLSNEQMQSENLAAVAKLMESTQAEREELSSLVIPSDGVADFLSYLEELGEQVGVDTTIDSVDELSIEGQNNLGYLKVEITVSGSWKNVYTFFSLLEVLPPDSRLSSVAFSRGGLTEEGIEKWSGQFTIEILRRSHAENS